MRQTLALPRITFERTYQCGGSAEESRLAFELNIGVSVSDVTAVAFLPGLGDAEQERWPRGRSWCFVISGGSSAGQSQGSNASVRLGVRESGGAELVARKVKARRGGRRHPSLLAYSRHPAFEAGCCGGPALVASAWLRPSGFDFRRLVAFEPQDMAG